MLYNSAMVANLKEEKLFRKAQKDAVLQLVLMMNQYHACDYRYYAKESIRAEAKAKFAEGMREIDHMLPDAVKVNVQRWKDNPDEWLQSIDRLWV